MRGSAASPGQAPEDWQAWQPGDPPPGAPLAIWRWNAPAARTQTSILSQEELSRAGNMAPRRGARFLADRSALRRILACHLARPPGSLAFSYSALGRPALAPRGKISLDFNLSHSGDLSVLAVCRTGAVGVDIEHLRALPDILAVARRVFPRAWVERLQAQPEAARRRAFFELWTRFEACQKATGRGVFSGVSAIVDQAARAFLVTDECIGHVCVSGAALPPDIAWLQLDAND
jgi:4'-phosphopantetheinyl transferase